MTTLIIEQNSMNMNMHARWQQSGNTHATLILPGKGRASRPTDGKWQVASGMAATDGTRKG